MAIASAAGAYRRPIALIAALMVVLQALLAGVVAGQAGAPAAVDPIDAAICHGAGDGGASGSDPTDRGQSRHLCCDYCTSSIAGITPPVSAAAHVLEPRPAGRLKPASGFTIVLAPGAVRAGPSQAPPAFA